MAKLIKAEQGLNHTVIYQDESGRLFCYSGGSWSWRNNNPGNLRSKRRGQHKNQIGVAGNLAVFPNYDAGLLALTECLKSEYKNFTIKKLTPKYAPPEENNTELYMKFLIKETGVTDGRMIKDFTPIEFEKLYKAIIKMEGYKVGNVVEIHQVKIVKKNHNRIFEIFVDTLGWVSKSDCFALTKAGIVNLVICHSAKGGEYLRARPNDPFQEELYKLVLSDLNHEAV